MNTFTPRPPHGADALLRAELAELLP
ncbi:hypothetical protein FB387_003830, partial [Streptomyces cinereoruber]|nr:hypothetical protein [Streptomyces cinereoruber]